MIIDFLNGLPPYELEIEIMAEADELWSYVGRKQNQRWTSYAVERKSGMIVGTDESCSCLTEKLSVFPVARYHTDDWKSCRKYIPVSKHVIGKADTWQIERRNLNFRTDIKRLINGFNPLPNAVQHFPMGTRLTSTWIFLGSRLQNYRLNPASLLFCGSNAAILINLLTFFQIILKISSKKFRISAVAECMTSSFSKKAEAISTLIFLFLPMLNIKDILKIYKNSRAPFKRKFRYSVIYTKCKCIENSTDDMFPFPPV